MRIQSFVGGKYKPYRHKFGIIYTGCSRVENYWDLRISPQDYDTRLWDKIHFKRRPGDDDDLGCIQMTAFRDEAMRLNREEEKLYETKWHTFLRDDFLFEQYHNPQDHK